MRTILVFGASGSIGQALCAHFLLQDCFVIGVGRQTTPKNSNPNLIWVTWGDDPSVFAYAIKERLAGKRLDSLVWAQGINFNDDIESFDLVKHQEMYDANVTFIPRSLQAIMKSGLLSKGARLCVISSIWQNIARQNKLSYCITKSALQGLVQSLTIDLGRLGILINAVLPGALDTQMTRTNLSDPQIKTLETATPLAALPQLSDVCGLVDFLCSTSNTGITGQFIAADRGFSHARIL